jgi:uncharacterized protein YjbJ (UPF0337 family)
MTIKTQLQQQSANLKDKAHDAVDHAKENLSEMQHKAAEKVGDLKDGMQHGTEALGSETQHLAHETKDQMGATVNSVTGYVQEFVGHLLDKPALEAEGLSRQAEADLQREHSGE